MKLRPLAAALVAAVVVPWFLVGCGGGDSSKEIVIDGSSTVFRISRGAAERYQKVKPDVTVVVRSSGTGGGFGKYKEGEIDIVDASRTAKPEEEEAAKTKNMPWTSFHVGFDGITLVVHPSNDFVKSLTVAQLKVLFEKDSKVKTWKDLDPSWPDRKITFYTPDKDSGTYEYFVEAILGKGKDQRDDVQPGSDDNVLVSGVSGEKDGIGYFGYAYFAANSGKLKAVPIQNGPDAKPVAPNPDTILDKSYSPLSRRLYIYVKNSSLQRAEVADFVKFYLDNVGELAKTGGYVEPTAEDMAMNKQSFASATAAPNVK